MLFGLLNGSETIEKLFNVLIRYKSAKVFKSVIDDLSSNMFTCAVAVNLIGVVGLWMTTKTLLNID